MVARSYLDHNATAPVLPEVRDAVARALGHVGNPSSVHAEGRRARAMIEHARHQVAALVGAEPDGVVFTSGGTEANVTALSPANAGGGAACCFVSAVEHPSVLMGGRFEGSRVSRIAVDGDGVVDQARLAAQLERFLAEDPGAPFLVSVMAANNETGVLQPVAEIANLVHGLGGVFHSDLVQAAGRLALDMGALGVDMASLSAHKIGGPAGVGALVLGENIDGLEEPGEALLTGGGQERRRRAGTENVAGIVGFGIAAEQALAGLERIGEVEALRGRLEDRIGEIAPETAVFAEGASRLPNTTCFAVEGMAAETLVIAFDLAGVALSAGSACSSGKVGRSHVLDAMGVGEDLARAAVRVSIGRETGEEDIERFAAAWRDIHRRFEERRPAA